MRNRLLGSLILTVPFFSSATYAAHVVEATKISKESEFVQTEIAERWQGKCYSTIPFVNTEVEASVLFRAISPKFTPGKRYWHAADYSITLGGLQSESKLLRISAGNKGTVFLTAPKITVKTYGAPELAAETQGVEFAHKKLNGENILHATIQAHGSLVLHLESVQVPVYRCLFKEQK